MRELSGSTGCVVGLLVVFLPPVGIACLVALVIMTWQADRHRSPRRGEAPRSVTTMMTATSVAPGTLAEPRRPREREPWTRIDDYVHRVY